MSEKKVATITLNVLYLIPWSHLCGNDVRTEIFSFTATPKTSWRVLMGQASKRLLTRSTSGMLGWRLEGLYKIVAIVKKGGRNLRRKKRKKKDIVLI